jgi:replicative DNA helicase
MTPDRGLYDLDLEQALVAEALRRYDRYIARGLSLADFTATKHVAILEACSMLWEQGKAVTVGAVALELQRAGKDLAVGGERGVAEVAIGSGKVADADALRDLSRLRAVREVAAKAIGQANERDLQGALSTLAEVDQLGAATQVTRNGAEVGERLLAALRAPDEGDRRRVYLGLRELDDAVGKLPVGAMMVIAADSNVGKSQYALAMLIAMAEANITCGLIGVEDPEDVTGARVLAAFTENVSSREIQHGRYGIGEPSAMLELTGAVAKLKRLGDRLLFEDRTGETELEVCAAMSRMAARGARLVVVDYVQEVGCSQKQQDRRNEVRWVTKRLKSHAKRLGIALVLVSQIARPKEGDEFKPPSKHALKESGDLVNMAEVILVLWRDAATDQAHINVRVAKVKYGGLGAQWTMVRNPSNGAMVEA